jgi:MYXO-CTERM domain-containing protein
LVSTDSGATWITRTIPLVVPDERAVYLAAVDPLNPLRVYARTSGGAGKPSRLLVTNDGGQTWDAKFTTKGAMLGFALSPDGSKAYLGGTDDGLYAASTADFAFAQRAKVQIQCLAARDGELWACSNEASGFIYGLSKDDGQTFETKLHLSTVRGPLACPPGTTTTDKCVPDWPRQRAELGVPIPGSDAGSSSDGGVGGEPPNPNGNGSSKCGCATTGSDALASWMAMVGGVGLLLRRRARRRRS